MANYCANHTQYGCGHHAEHVEAARKGWITRRDGAAFQGREDAVWFGELFPNASHVHTHPNHKNEVVFKQGRKWFSLPVSAYRDLAREGRAAMQAREKAKRAAIRQAAQERKAGEKATVVDARKRAHDIKVDYAWRVSMARLAEKEARRDWHTINAHLSKVGVREGYQRKVATYRKGSDKVYWVARPAQEYLELPAAWRKRNGRFTPDEARGYVAENISGFEDTDLNDFAQWIEQHEEGAKRYRAYLSKLADERDEALAALRRKG